MTTKKLTRISEIKSCCDGKNDISFRLKLASGLYNGVK